MLSNIELSELIAVKLCHDLSGPIGAFNNGIELLEDKNSTYFDESLKLVKSTSQDTVNRVLYFRQAYGTTSKNSLIPIGKIDELARNFFSSTKVNFKVETKDANLAIDNYFSKLILNSLLFASKALIVGGELKLVIHENKNAELIGTSDKVKVDDAQVVVIQAYDEQINIDIKNITAHLIWLLLQETNKKMEFDYDETNLKVSIG